MKIKPIILMLVFLMSYLLIAIPYSDNVRATTTTTTIDFETAEGGSVGQEFPVSPYTSMISTKQIGGLTHGESFKVTASAYHGSKGMILNAGATGYTISGLFNLSYSTSSFLTEISMFIYSSFEYAPYSSRHYINVYFFNTTLNTNCWSPTNYAFKYSYISGTGAVGWTMAGQGMADYGNSAATGTWTFLNTTISNDMGDIVVYNKNIVNGHTDRHSSNMYNTSYALNDIRIDRVLFTHTAGSPYYSNTISYVDYVNITTSNTYSTGGGVSPSDFSQYRTIGSLPTEEISTGGSYPVVEKRYENDFSGLIYGIDIPMFQDNTVWNGHSWVSSLPAWSIGFNVGINGMTYTPDLVYNVSVYGISDPLHVYRFDFSSSPLTLDNEKILIEFYSAITSSSGSYFYPSPTGYDSDLDGVIQTKRGDLTYFDGIYNGQLTDNNHDFAYLLYYEGAMGEIPEEETTYNFLSIYGGRYTNTSGQPLFYKNDTVSMGWGVSDMTVSNIIRIKYAGVNITLQGFPYTLYSPKGAIAYCPENNGNYTVYLYVNSVKTITKYFDVISNPDTEENSYQIHTLPPSTYDYTQYTVKYNYINPAGYEGRIALFKNYYDVSNYTKNIYNRTIESNTTGGQFLYLPIDLEKNDYWMLFVKVGSSLIPKGNYHIHYLMKSGLSSYLSIDYGQRFGDTAKIGVPITVTGYHPYILQDVNVFVNGLPIQYVGTTQSFSFTYTPVKTGTHIFQLSVRLNNGTNYILADKECIVYEPEDDEGGGGIIPSGWSIDPPFSYFLGIAIIIITTMSPLIVIKGINREFNLSTIPQFLYLIMGVIGFIISIVLGFFPAWSLLVLVVIAVLILAILWLKGNSNQVG